MITIEVKQVSNGYIIRSFEERAAEGVIEYPVTDDENISELITFKRLCLLLRDEFEVFNSKHNKYRIDIVITNQQTGETYDETIRSH
jgi:hypothetical protein